MLRPLMADAARLCLRQGVSFLSPRTVFRKHHQQLAARLMESLRSPLLCSRAALLPTRLHFSSSATFNGGNGSLLQQKERRQAPGVPQLHGCDQSPGQAAGGASRLLVRASGGSRKKSGFAQLLTARNAPSRPLVRPKRPLVKGVVSPKRGVPPGIPRPPYADSGKAPGWVTEYEIQDEEGMARMRAAGQLAARVRDQAGTLVKPGVTTDEIDALVHQLIIDAGAYPSPLNYGAFPKSVCTSVNECICHGIPDSRPLEDGDIINIDVTVFLDGYHGDTSRMFLCGSVSPQARKLVKVTEEALEAAIAICKPGLEFKQIGAKINAVADKHNFGVVKQFVGHGVGRVFHAGPAIIHCRNNEPGRMRLGQTFTIEPMLTAGGAEVDMWDDEWTAVTQDGCLSAQCEHTLLILEDGAEVLTRAQEPVPQQP